MITHFGFNRTDIGHYNKPRAWIPVVNLLSGPAYAKYDVHGKVLEYTPLKAWLEHIIKNQERLCRIWVLYSDGKQECVYYYEQDILKL